MRLINIFEISFWAYYYNLEADEFSSMVLSNKNISYEWLSSKKWMKIKNG